jgi:hypothetical protein
MKIAEAKKLFQKLKETPRPAKRNKWVEVFNNIAIHSRERSPKDLLLKKRPNEDEKIHTYRVENYRPITYASFHKGMDILHRIFAAMKWEVSATDKFHDYLNTARFKSPITDEVLSVRAFFEKIVLSFMIEDPNAYLVWLPTGEGLNNPAKNVDVQPEIIHSGQIEQASENMLFYKKQEKGKDVFYLIDRESVFYGTENDRGWNITEYYQHDIGTLPAIKLGGLIHANGYYESYFKPFVAFANEAIVQFSDWQATMTQSAFPLKEVKAEPCDNPNCKGALNSKFEIDCKVCGNTGYKVPNSPHGTLIKHPPEKLQGDSPARVNWDNIPGVQYIAPPVDIVRYSGETWEKLLSKAEAALNIIMIDEAQSGKAKEIDRESQYSMLEKIANNFFDNIMLKSLNLINAYVFLGKEGEISINKPRNYAIRTEQNIIDDIDKLNKANAPNYFRAEAARELAQKKYATNRVAIRTFDILNAIDPLSVYSIADKQAMYMQGVISQRQYQTSIFAYAAIERLRTTAPEGFMSWTVAELVEKINGIIDKMIEKENPTPIVDGNGRTRTE